MERRRLTALEKLGVNRLVQSNSTNTNGVGADEWFELGRAVAGCKIMKGGPLWKTFSSRLLIYLRSFL